MQKNALSNFLRKLFDSDFLIVWGLFLIPVFTTTELHDYYTVPKWSLVYVMSVLAGVFLIAQHRDLHLPVLNRFAKIIGGLTVLFLVGNYYYHNVPFNHHYTLDRLCFVILVLYGIQTFSKKTTLSSAMFVANLVATAFVIAQGIEQFYGCRIVNHIADANCFPSTFGNINMTAQFLGVSLVFQLFSIPKKIHKYVDWSKPLIFILSVMYIYHAMCRSIYIATTLLLATVFIVQRPIQRKKLVGLLFCSLLAITIVSLVSKQESPTYNMKESSTSNRLETYKDTLRMVKENPLGIGVGRFEFGFVPYQMGGKHWPSEEEVFKSPHDSFLRYLSEDGIILSSLFLILLVAILWCRREGKFDDTSLLMYLFLIVLFIEALFQFPLEDAYPFYVFAILLGRYIAKNQSLRAMPRMKAPIMTVLLTVIVSGLTVTFVISKYLEANFYTDYEKSKIACSLQPYNWRACLNKAKIEAERDPKEAFQTLRRELEKRPFNHVAMGIWGTLELRLGRESEGCKALLIRDAFFDNLSSYTPFIAARCINYLGVLSDSPLKDHRDWLLQNNISLKSPIIK